MRSITPSFFTALCVPRNLNHQRICTPGARDKYYVFDGWLESKYFEFYQGGGVVPTCFSRLSVKLSACGGT